MVNTTVLAWWRYLKYLQCMTDFSMEQYYLTENSLTMFQHSLNNGGLLRANLPNPPNVASTSHTLKFIQKTNITVGLVLSHTETICTEIDGHVTTLTSGTWLTNILTHMPINRSPMHVNGRVLHLELFLSSSYASFSIRITIRIARYNPFWHGRCMCSEKHLVQFHPSWPAAFQHCKIND